MDFDQIETFLEVARLSSFSRAAEKRFRTQPAISAQIRGIEEEVGAKLLDRSGGKVALTAAGKIFQKYAEETVHARRNMITAIAEMESVPGGDIIVGANEGTCLHVLPEVFAQFKKQYPTVGVSVRRLESAKVMESVFDHAIDFGIVSLPVTDKRLTVVPIHRDELVSICAPSHELAMSGKVTVDRLSKYPLLVPKFGKTREAIEDMFASRNLPMTISMELDSSELLKRFAAADVGVGFIGESTVQQEVEAGTLVALQIKEVHIRRDLGLTFRKDKALSRAALAFIEIAVKLKGKR
jgi:DNA-binding transcriptional LysR family regulator